MTLPQQKQNVLQCIVRALYQNNPVFSKGVFTGFENEPYTREDRKNVEVRDDVQTQKYKFEKQKRTPPWYTMDLVYTRFVFRPQERRSTARQYGFPIVQSQEAVHVQ